MKTERFELRFDRDTLDQLEAWRADQPDLPSRAEAVRRLIHAGLSASGKEEVRISDGEKLILMMLGDLCGHQGVDSEIDPRFVADAISSGHYWGLDWKYPGLFHGHADSRQTVSEVVDILDMWTFIETGYASLSEAEKKKIALDAHPYGDHVKFHGFDGNNESSHLAIARFMIEKLGRFPKLGNRDLNSHSPSIERYRRMVAIFEPIRQTLVGREISSSEIVTLLNLR